MSGTSVETKRCCVTSAELNSSPVHDDEDKCLSPCLVRVSLFSAPSTCPRVPVESTCREYLSPRAPRVPPRAWRAVRPRVPSPRAAVLADIV